MLFKKYLRLVAFSCLVIFLIGLITVGGAFYYFTRTPTGAEWLLQRSIKSYVNAQAVHYEKLSGTIAKGIKLSNVEIVNLNIFEERNTVRIQNLELMIPGLDLKRAIVKIENGRIQFPVSDPIGFYGTLEHGILAFHIYCGILDVRELTTIFKNDLTLRNLNGTAKEAALIVTGPYTQPVLRGEFILEDFKYLGFSLHDMPANFGYVVSRGEGGILWNGVLTVPSGRVISRLTTVHLQESKLIFEGSFRNPALDIKGTSKIEQVDVNFALKGTKRKPQLILTSNPPKPKNILLLMLATGQEVKLSGAPLNTDELSQDSVSEFVDYFTFSNDGGRFSNNVGLSDFSVKMGDNSVGVGIKRRVTEQVKVGVNLEETKTPAGGNNPDLTTRTIGGEVQVLDNITLGVDKKVTQATDPAKKTTTTVPERNDGEVDVMLKYKKNF